MLLPLRTSGPRPPLSLPQAGPAPLTHICPLQTRDSLRDQIVALVLGTDMKQHFGTCGAFGAKVLAPLRAATAAAAAAAAAASTVLDTVLDRGDSGSVQLQRIQMDDEAQMLTWKVRRREGGRKGGREEGGSDQRRSWWVRLDCWRRRCRWPSHAPAWATWPALASTPNPNATANLQHHCNSHI